MSIFDSASSWPDRFKACGAPNQSPINLSQSFSVPCDRLCEWIVDEVSVGEAHLANHSENHGGLILRDFTNGKPTASYNGEGYSCEEITLYSTSQHSLESVFGEAELVAKFTHPTGKTVCMSIIVRTSPGDTPSSKFFNAFVPYSDSDTTIKLGDTWSLTDILPDTPAYFVYTGTTLTPPCEPDVIWIVYSNTVTMDPSDYAKLAKNVRPARRPLEEVGDREVTFFDAAGISTPRDGKLYFRCRKREGIQKEEKPLIQKGGLQETVDKQEKESTTQKRNNFNKSISDSYAGMGGLWGILEVLTLLVISWLLFFTEAGKKIGGIYFVIIFFMPNLVRTFAISLFTKQRT